MALTPEDQAIIDKLNETGWTADPSEPPPLTDEDAQPDQPALALIQGGAGKAEKPKLVVRTPAELRANLGEIHPIRAAYLVDGAITILDGAMKKSGKTTFALALSKSVIEGSVFLDVQSNKSPVVYMNESPPVSFIQAIDNAGLSESDDLHIVNFHENFNLEWPEKVKQAVELAKKVGAGLLVVDTFSQWAGVVGEDENSAGKMLEAIKPIQEHAQTARLAILFIRHTRKSGGGVGESGRGSTAVTGAVDDIVLIWKPDGPNHNQRFLDWEGRNNHPDHQVVELVDDEYRLIGTPSQAKAENLEAEIIRVLTDEPQTAPQLGKLVKANQVKFRTDRLRPAIAKLLAAGHLTQSGLGSGRSPHKYARKSMESTILASPVRQNDQNQGNLIESMSLASPASPPTKGGDARGELGRQTPTREPGDDDDGTDL